MNKISKSMTVDRDTRTLKFFNYSDIEIAFVLGSSKYVKNIKWWKKFKVVKTYSVEFSDFFKDLCNNE